MVCVVCSVSLSARRSVPLPARACGFTFLRFEASLHNHIAHWSLVLVHDPPLPASRATKSPRTHKAQSQTNTHTERSTLHHRSTTSEATSLTLSCPKQPRSPKHLILVSRTQPPPASSVLDPCPLCEPVSIRSPSPQTTTPNGVTLELTDSRFRVLRHDVLHLPLRPHGAPERTPDRHGRLAGWCDRQRRRSELRQSSSYMFSCWLPAAAARRAAA